MLGLRERGYATRRDMVVNPTAAAFVVIAALVAPVSCATARMLRPARPTCPDGLPVKILQDPACGPDGVCGYSCNPGRWEKKPPC